MRNERPRRRTIRQQERFKVWLAAGGRCSVCNTDLLEGRLTSLDLSLGELAHIVGQSTALGSPRGEADLPEEERDLAANLMLVCASEHDEIDRDGAVEVLRVRELRRIKRSHEEWIRRVTSLAPNRGTVVLRMIGTVRGNPVELTKPTATEAVIRSDERFPDYPLSEGRYGVEIDLRELPGEWPTSEAYWATAIAKIDEVIDHKLSEAVRAEHVPHLSVFAFARLPLLIYLGSKLDDPYGVLVYQRHRDHETWEWPANGESRAFDISVPSTMEGNEAVCLLSVSGTINTAELPPGLAQLPRMEIRPDGGPGDVDAIRTPGDLAAFELALRSMWARLEAAGKGVRRLHVFAALPMSAAVALGRTHHQGVSPTLLIYDRRDAEYVLALEIR